MSDNLKNLLNSFKTSDELKAYIEAQQLSFIEVSKKVRTLEEENEKLQKKIKKLETEKNKESNIELEAQEVSHSEIICLSQIEALKRITEERTHTLEETKKFEIYQRILGQIVLSKKNKDDKLAKASDDELLRLVSGGKSDG